MFLAWHLDGYTEDYAKFNTLHNNKITESFSLLCATPFVYTNSSSSEIWNLMLYLFHKCIYCAELSSAVFGHSVRNLLPTTLVLSANISSDMI